MHGISCDRCGAALLVGTSVRYVVAIDVRAAYDVMEVSREEIEADHRKELSALLARLEGLDPAEAQRQVHCAFRFDLCPPCQKDWVADPLAASPPPPLRLDDVERAAIGRALREAGGDAGRAAEMMGLKRAALARRMKRLGMKQKPMG